jgi:hypothetical protein
MKIGQVLRFFSRPASLVSHGAHADWSHHDAPRQAPLLWRLLPWLRPADADEAPALAEAREAFIEALQDIDCREACCLSMRIRYAHSMQALWHFRSDVFLLVSLHRSQSEALSRLDTLNQHFPTRSPRSGFGALLD